MAYIGNGGWKGELSQSHPRVKWEVVARKPGLCSVNIIYYNRSAVSSRRTRKVIRIFFFHSRHNGAVITLGHFLNIDYLFFRAFKLNVALAQPPCCC